MSPSATTSRLATVREVTGCLVCPFAGQSRCVAPGSSVTAREMSASTLSIPARCPLRERGVLVMLKDD